MVMSGSHYHISSFPSRETKEGAMEKNLKADHFVNEENLDTHEINSSSPMDNLESVPLVLDCLVVTNFPCIVDIDQECFPTASGSFIENSFSNDSCDFLPSSNHECVLEDISDSHILQGKNKHVDLFTPGE